MSYSRVWLLSLSALVAACGGGNGDTPQGNAAPRALAGSDQVQNEGTLVTLDGGESFDPNGTIQEYFWEQTSGPDISLTGEDTATARFTAPATTAPLALSFRLTVTDNAGATDTDEVEVTVNPVNLAPVASDDSATTAEDTAVLIAVLANDTDPDDAASTTDPAEIDPASVVVSNAVGGSASVTNGGVRFTPDLNFSGEASFRYTVADRHGAISGPATVTIDVSEQPEAVLNVADATIGEAGGTLDFVVSLSRAPDGPVRVDFTSADGSARAGQDYAAAAGSLAFTPEGPLSQLVRVAVTNDTFDENDEGLSLMLWVGSGTASAEPGDLQASGLIQDDDVSDLLRIGASRRSVKPSQAHIDGVVETRLGGTERTQKFNLGGFGINPLQSFPDPADQAGEQLTQPAEIAAFSGSRGEEPIQLRVMLMEQSGGERLAFVTLDAIGAGNIIQDGVKAAVSGATGIAPENILFGQTHSHAGPDLQGLWGGVPEDWIQNTLYVAAADAAAEALAASRPARLTLAQGQTVQFNNYRRPRINPAADADGTLTLLEAVGDDGTPVGSILQYNAHPTSIDENPRSVHADYIQGAMDWIETKNGGVGLYYNGPIADASGSGGRTGCAPAPQDGNYGNVRCRGEGIADQALQYSKRELAPTLAVDEREVILPITNPGFLAFGAIGSFNRYYNFVQQVPVETIPGIGPEAKNLPQATPTATTLVSRVTVGGAAEGLEIVTIPGETTNTFGQYIRSLAQTNVMLLGLTHNSFGYILPEEEFSYVDQTGDAGLVAPFTGYEENVSLGPLTAPLLRSQGYNRLFGVDPATGDTRDLPPTLTACFDDMDSPTCLLQVIENRIDLFIEQWIAGGAATLSEFCHDNAGDFEAICVIPDTLAGLVGGLPAPGAGADADLLAAAADAQLRGCDLIDTSNCLYPFPNDWFTAEAAPGTIQHADQGGTGRRVNLNPLATPRNSAGKPVDPTEWNRSDGFSPGALIATYVPQLSLEATFARPSHEIGVANLALSQDPDAPILVLEVQDDGSAPVPHLVWSEIDQNANLLTITGAPNVGTFPIEGLTNEHGHVSRPLNDGKAALLIRPGKNFAEGKRYVVVLRNLKNADGAALAAQAGFRACLAGDSALPPVQARCEQLQERVFPVLEDAGIALDDSLYVAWDFTVESTESAIGRLRHMRDTAFASLSSDPSEDDCTRLTPANAERCAAPKVEITTVTENPQNGIARRIEGMLTVPNYLAPVGPSPLDNPQVAQAIVQMCANAPEGEFASGCNDLRDGADLAQGAALPSRLFYSPADGTPAPDAANPFDPTGLRYGDGLPDANGTMTTRFLCQIPAQATADNPARASLYGHGQLDRGVAITYEGTPDVAREHNYMFCAVDWFGFRTGDAANVASALIDLSNFPVIPDASQQGMLNFMFLARAMGHPQGLGALPEFQGADGRPLFDAREIFYNGNSQGGIFGGVVLAASKDVNRGVLGSLGMNYSTLLTRSKNFDEYAGVLYSSYTDPLDRQLLFSMMQMLWDRSENNGYAHHITDNTAFGGPSNVAKLDPQFGDPQVTMFSAEVMARTMGVPFDNGQTLHVETLGEKYLGVNGRRHPGVEAYEGLAPLQYGTDQVKGSALVVWDTNHAGDFAHIPPITNTPPRAEDRGDPHDASQKAKYGRCHMAHFLRTDGELIDIRGVQFRGEPCPAVPPAKPTVRPGTSEAPADVLGQFLSALAEGDLIAAVNTIITPVQQAFADAFSDGAQQAGELAGIALPTPGQDPAPELREPEALRAGVAKRAIQVPVGTPLGGYLRPPVGGEYIGDDPVGELTDNIPAMADGCDPAQPDSCPPLAPLPDELRKVTSPFATYSPPSRGYYDSLIAKAVALHDGHDYVVLVKTDFIGMLDELVQDVKAEVKARKGIELGDGLIMSATHSHDGPGAVANHSTRYFWLAMDVYQPEVYRRVVGQLADVVVAALEDLRPARIGHGSGLEREGLNGYRRGRLASYADDDAPDGDGLTDADELRSRIGVLRVDDAATGETRALVINWAAHGIAFDVENQYFSGDVLGAVERETEQLMDIDVAMLVQSVGGDVSPRGISNDNKLQRIESYGKRLAPQVKAVAEAIGAFQDAPDLRAVSQRIVLNRERLGYAGNEYPYPWGAGQCGNDIAVPFADVGVRDIPGYEDSGLPVKQPYCLPSPPPDANDLADNGVAENGAFYPQDTILTAASIGDITIMVQPGEPLVEYGVRLMEMAGREGFDADDTFVWGYAGDHIGYILPPVEEDWATFGGAESTTTFWGWKQGERFIDVTQGLLVALRDGTAAPADEFQVDYTKYRQVYDAVPAPVPAPSILPGTAVAQPSNIKRFERTAFVFEGGDPVVDFPAVRMLNADGTPVRRANGEAIDTFFEMHLKYRLVSGRHLWTVEFEAPKDWAAGGYRFAVSGQASQGSTVEYQLESANFTVAPATNLQLGDATCADGQCSVRASYTPVPSNYRVVDARVPADQAAPMRTGTVTFSNGSDTVVVEADGSGTFAAALDGNVTVVASDGFGNTAPQLAIAAGPNPDRDGDGVSNETDACPDQSGPASNNGCPEQAAGFPLCEPFQGYCLSDIPGIGEPLQAAIDTVYNALTGGGTGVPPEVANLMNDPTGQVVDCAGPAGDPAEGTPEFAKRDADNIFCTTQRHGDALAHPANIRYMTANYGADPYREPARLAGKRFRHENINIAGVDAQRGESFQYNAASNAEVYYPCAAGTCTGMPPELSTFEPPYPIAIVMHGAASDKKHLEWVTQPLAEHGYFVVTANGTADGLPGVLLDWLFSSSNPYKDMLDLSRIGTAGHSLGAENATRVQGDPLARVSGIVAFDPCDGTPNLYECKNSAGSRLHDQGAAAQTPTLFLTADYLGFPGYPQPQVTVPGDLRLEGFGILRDNGVDTMLITPRATTHLDWAGAFTFGNRYNEATSLYYTLAWFDRYVKAKLVVANGEVVTQDTRTAAEERAFRQAIADQAYARLVGSSFDSLVDLHNISQGYYDEIKAAQSGDPVYGGNVPYVAKGMALADRLSFYHRSVCSITQPDLANGNGGKGEPTLARADTTEDGDMRATGCVTTEPGGNDTDGDGFPDDADECPTEAGPNKGCPEQPPVTGEAGYGTGVIGLLAELAADFNDVITSMVDGDMDGAQSGIEQAVANAQQNAEGIGESTTPGEVLGTDEELQEVVLRAASANREVEPVVMTWAQVQQWDNGPVAIGVAKPYPSGAGKYYDTPDQACGELPDNEAPFDTGDFPNNLRDFCRAYLADGLSKGPSGDQVWSDPVRNAYNGTMLFPAQWQPGDPPEETGLMPAEQLAAFRWNAQTSAFEEIPVQVDERKPYFLANANSGFSFYSGTDEELSYVWDTESWGMTKGECSREYDPSGWDTRPTQPDRNTGISRAIPDPMAGLDADDEVVFMASDAGAMGPMSGGYPEDWDWVYIVRLADPLDPAAERVVYLVRRAQGSSFRDKRHYVHYQRDADADQWIDRSFFADSDPHKLGTSNTGYGPNLTGTVCKDGVAVPSNDRFPRDGVTVTTGTYRWQATGRWMVRDVRVRQPEVDSPDPAYWQSRPDLIDRWKGRAFQQSPDSTVSLVGFEDEQVNWEANSTLLGERCGPVRCLREVWGADSGTNVTKLEIFYRDLVSYRYHVRVHPIPPDGLYTSWDYNRSAMVDPATPGAEGRYFTALRPQGVPIDGKNDEVGQVDSIGGFPAFFDAADPTFNLPLAFSNWEQVSGKDDLGSLVYLFELKGPTSLATPAVQPYYRDDACLDDGTGDDPVQRPYPGEPSTDSGVKNGYAALAGKPYEQLGCTEKQGAHAQHGVHYFFTGDVDNAAAPKPVNEIDGVQWQFMVPTARPKNIAEPYANVVRAPLQPVVVWHYTDGESGGGGEPGPAQNLPDYETCMAMAQEGGAEDHEAAAKYACAVIFGGGSEDGDIQGPTHYVPMSDGTLIAANIYIPWGCNVAKNPDAKPCASILEMSGYDGGSDDGPTPSSDFEDILTEESGGAINGVMPLQTGSRSANNKYYRSSERYVSVVASVRGSGCSSGEFDLFSRKSALDGHELIEWMADQEWSNGKVGLFGHSYSGITAAMIASTNPPSLKMATLSGQIGDLYRDIVYPGGVSNYGFPLLWTGGVRVIADVGGGQLAGMFADNRDRQCALNVATHTRTVTGDPLVNGLSETDGDWYRQRSVVNFLEQVRAPTQIITAYQDEQTGPRGGTHVFDKLPQGVTRRLVMLNGDHGSQVSPTEVIAERRFWMDAFMLDANDSNPNRRPRDWDPKTSLPKPVIANNGAATSRVLLEVNAGAKSNGHIDSSGFPLSQTQWTDFYFHGADGTLDTAKETVAHGEAGSRSTWVNGSKRQAYSYQANSTGFDDADAVASAPDADGADELVFALDIDSVAQDYTATNGTAQKAFVIAGPVMADLYISSTAPDTELMVQLIDADPATGERLYLQRGVLRASHRVIDPSRSQCAAQGSGGRITQRACTSSDNIYRPYRTHVNPQDIVPNEVVRYRLELYPVGHVLRAGHQLLVKVHAPSLDDNDWAYISRTAPALNTLHHSAEYPSSLRLPVIPLAAVSRLGGPTAACSDDSMRCVYTEPLRDAREECRQLGDRYDPTGFFTAIICGGTDAAGDALPVGGQGEPSLLEQLGVALGTVLDPIVALFGGDADPATPARFQVGTGSADQTPTDRVCFGSGSMCSRSADPTTEPDAVRDPMLARATAITGANGQTFIVVTTTNIGYFLAYKPEQSGYNGIYDARLRIANATGVPSTHITVVSDHSHNGPDTIGIWGGVSAEYMKITADSVVEAAIRAYESRRDAVIKVAAVNQNEDPVAGVPRLDSSYDLPPGNDLARGNPYNEFRLLVADDADTGERILTFVNYAPHATVTNGDQFDGKYRLTGDWAAWAPQEAEAIYGGMGVATIGTVGSTDWNKSGDIPQREAEARARLRTLMAAATARLQPVSGTDVQVESTFVREPLMQPALLLNYKPGLDRNTQGTTPVTDASFGRDLRIDRSVLPPFMTGAVAGTYVSAIRVGDVFISTFPGEPFGELDHAIADEGRVQGAREHFLLGGANDFFGYMVKNPETYEQTARTGALWVAGCREEDVAKQVGVREEGEGACSDHWSLMVSPTFGSHIVCTLQDQADRLGFTTANRDAECAALTALDGMAPPPESGDPAAAASFEARKAAVAQAHELAAQCRATAAPTQVCDALEQGAREAEVLAGVPGTTAEGDGRSYAGVAVKDASWHLGASAGQFAASGAGIANDRGYDPYGHSTRKVGSDILGTRITTRALVVQGANGERIAIASNDLYLPNDLLHRRTAQLLAEHDLAALASGGVVTGITDRNLATTSSHSHTSPFYSTPAWGTWIFQDVFDLRFYEYMARQMADAVIEAASTMKPVRMGGATVHANDIQSHTYKPVVAHDGTPAGQPTDYTTQAVTVVSFDDISTGVPKPLANWVIFGVHPEWVWGEEIVNGDITHAVMRMLDRETGAVTLWSQRETGSSGPHKDERVHLAAERREFQESNFAGYDRAARLLTDSIKRALGQLASNTPERPDQFARYQTGFDVGFASQRFAPPVTRPYPGTSNCNSDRVFEGDVGTVVVPGLPDCSYDVDEGADEVVGTDPGPIAASIVEAILSEMPGEMREALDPVHQEAQARASELRQQALGVIDAAKQGSASLARQLNEAGVPIPTSYSGTSFTAVQETAAVHLQVFKLGTIAATMSPNEQFTSQALNIESRLDKLPDNLWHGFDFACVAQARGLMAPDSDPKIAGHCARQNARYPEERLELPGGMAALQDEDFPRARAQIHNDASGWELDPVYAANSGDTSGVSTLGGEAEPEDITQIKGNFTHEEFTDHGYDLVVSVGMANDYWGYMAEYREYRSHSNGYRKALNALGPHGADFVATRLTRMAANLNGAGVALPYNPLDTAYQAESARAEGLARTLGELARAYTTAYDATLPPDGGVPGIVAQPVATVKRFSAATLKFVGGSNYTDLPRVRVERRVNGAWQTYGTQEGEVQLQLKFLPSAFSLNQEIPEADEGVGIALPDPQAYALWRAGQFEWVWTANFEAFVSELDNLGNRPGITPAGTYRFVVDGQHRGLMSFPNAAPYQLVSQPFEVTAWDGITVEDLQVGTDGRVSFIVGPVNTFTQFREGPEADDPIVNRSPGYTVGPVDYPDSYEGGISWIRNERQLLKGDQQYCARCTFRPWADSAQLAVDSIPVTVTRANGSTTTLLATRSGDRWVTGSAIAVGSSAQVPAGVIVDQYGEKNGAASAVVARSAPPSDTDGDGIPDGADACPAEPGPADNNGCPLPPADTDGDGVPDDTDACDTEAGPASNNGCPEEAPAADPLTQLIENVSTALTNFVDNVTATLTALADSATAQVEALVASPETAGEQVTAAAQNVVNETGVVNSDNPWTRRRPLNIAHRGGENDWPENTMFAYAESIRAAGSDMIEMDIYETADGELVVIHDDSVDRTTNGTGAVSSFTLAQIRALDAAYWFAQDGATRYGTSAGRPEAFYVYRGIATGERALPTELAALGYGPSDFRIPTLREIFENPRFANVLINIELKPDEDSTGQYEAKLAAMIREYGREDDVIVASFLDHNLALFKANAPEVATSVPTAQAAVDKGAGSFPAEELDGTHPGLGATVGHKAYQVPMDFGGIKVLSAEYIADAHARGMAVHAWTINDRADMVKLLNWCVDGIMTDNPLDLEDVLQSNEWSCPLDPAPATSLQHFVGSLHEHSGFSDGTIGTTPADYFAAGRTYGLDFMAGSEHSDNAMAPVTANTDCFSEAFFDCVQTSPDGIQKWNATLAIADAAYEPGVYSAIRGFEWTSDRHGHINVFFSQNDLNAKTGTGYALSMEDFWQWLALPPALSGGSDGLAVFNHPGREDDVHGPLTSTPLGGDPAYAWNGLAYQPEHDSRMVGIEMYGKSGDYYDANTENNAPAGGWYAYALDQGWHVAPVGAEDEHGTAWGSPQRAKTVMLAKENTRAGLRGAMAARRFYALAHGHGDVRVDFTAGASVMGSRLSRAVGTPLSFNVQVSDVDAANGIAAARIEVIGPGGVVLESATGLSHGFQATVTDGEQWRFVRVLDASGKVLAVSAPIWFAGR